MRHELTSLSRTMVVPAILALALATGPAHAGEGNTIYILQQSEASSVVGNTLSIDQSNANFSIVLGPSQALRNQLSTITMVEEGNVIIPLESQRALVPTPPATQRGEGNAATVTMTGQGGEVQLYQDNSGQIGLLTGNTAAVTVFGAGIGAVLQVGDGNNATLNLQGNLASGLISQQGTGLSASLNVGAGATGQIIQIGTGSTTGLTPVTVGPNTSLTYTQIGNGLAPVVGVAGVQVFTTVGAAAITITQTGF